MSRAWRSFANAWNRFFFEPISPATIGLYRIAIGIPIFLSTLGRFPFRDIFYTDHGIVTYANMSRHILGNPWLNFRWLPAQDPALELYFLAFLVVIVSMILGFQSRLCSVLVYLGLMSLNHRNAYIDNAGDDVLRISAFFLMFAPSGAAYSVDRWLRVRRGLEGRALRKQAPWAQRMLQLQLSFLYLETAGFKFLGVSWRDGTAMYYAINYVELQRFDFKYVFYYLWQIKLATWGTLAAELSAGSLIWVRRFRYWILAMALALHEGINLAMQFPVFQYAMMANLVLFLYPEDVEWLVARVTRKSGALVTKL